MSECVDEQQTRHYLGRWHGFGVVRDNEYVLYAVFGNTDRAGKRLTQNSFTRNLNNTSQSLGRASVLTREVFDLNIAHGAIAEIASAHVSAIRSIRADVPENKGTKNVRAVCVIDQVEAGDCDAHATMGLSEAIGPGLSEKNLAKLRARIRLDLANAFSEIIPLENHHWPRAWQVFAKRIGSIAKVAFGL